MGSGEALRADALVTVDTINATSFVFAGIRIAVVDLVLAVYTAVTGRAGALVPGAGFRTLSAILAGFVYTGLCGVLAKRAVEASRTHASVIGGVRTAHACATVRARRLQAVVHQVLALGAGETLRTLARITALAGVEARSAVAAGLVVRAEVQVLVAEQSTPSLVAHAIPRLHTAAMDASWVSLALVT